MFGMATTGFNLDRTALIDRSKMGSTSKYGKSALQRAHPGWNVYFDSNVGRKMEVDYSGILSESSSKGESNFP